MNGLPEGLGGALAFCLGASIGSFATTVAYRLPRDLSIASPRSYCESCERPIPWWANIPIFSYIGLRGRCVMCGATIPARHILTEASLAIIALYLYLTFPLGDAIARFALCAGLFVCSLVDYDWRLIPNLITFPGIPLGFFAACFLMPEIGWRNSAIGIAVGGGVPFLTGETYYLLRKQEGIGMGDVWLLAMTGAFLGWQGVLFTLFVGSIFGSVGGIVYALSGAAAKPAPEPMAPPDAEEADSILRTAVPFGPFLSLAAGIYALFQNQLVHWYFSH